VKDLFLVSVNHGETLPTERLSS